MARIRTNELGWLIYPNRGNPPIPPEGYEPDPTDPFVLIPIFEQCSQRKLVTYNTPCGRKAGRYWCKLHDCEATPSKCSECPDIDLIPVSAEILDAPSMGTDIIEIPPISGVVHDMSVSQVVPLEEGV